MVGQAYTAAKNRNATIRELASRIQTAEAGSSSERNCTAVRLDAPLAQEGAAFISSLVNGAMPPLQSRDPCRAFLRAKSQRRTFWAASATAFAFLENPDRVFCRT